jgi:hypothetical protein
MNAILITLAVAAFVFIGYRIYKASRSSGGHGASGKSGGRLEK